ncbi:DUF2169 domain-containing protein, partial [Massilia sp. DJPM01]|uniref:DUF2169 domain-containing protein n=1 Tax=Massilia sp. DJPM01 TaxID=3024404 RepID=UPI00259F1CFF
RLDFTLPSLSLDVTFNPKDGASQTLPARADTLLLEPDRQRFSVTWRVAKPLRRTVDEISHVEVGTPEQDFDPIGCCRGPAIEMRL